MFYSRDRWFFFQYYLCLYSAGCDKARLMAPYKYHLTLLNAPCCYFMCTRGYIITATRDVCAHTVKHYLTFIEKLDTMYNVCLAKLMKTWTPAIVCFLTATNILDFFLTLVSAPRTELVNW